ncbi:MAG: FkbM family methyltransferase [Gammaproteobacteria bacterium]|nr:FkbM family methyltransferase [Gammaproteobacteria bacterium]
MKNSAQRFIKHSGFTIYYDNEESMQQTLDEVFNDGYYLFESAEDSPLIIDAGSNIGIATLFFKKYHPRARIVCFEPDPNAFSCLKKNVAMNELKDVTLINAALSKVEGTIDFYGQIHMDHPDSRGNSIIDSWGIQREICNQIQVKSVKLSSYINGPIDFLKLDIEGAEQQVLEEIGNKLDLIKAMTLEFHETEMMRNINELTEIKTLLLRHQFHLDIHSKDLANILPESTQAWASKAKPFLHTIKAVKT